MHPRFQALHRSALACGLAIFVAGAAGAVEVELGLVAGGVRYLLGEHALIRLEGRGTGVLVSDGGTLACSFPPGGCRLGVTGSTLGAFSARLSVAARF